MMAGARKIALLALLAGCTQMTGYYPDGKVVTIDGEAVLVRQLPGRERGYHAVPNRPDPSTLFTRDPAISLRNIRAIEAVTGCTVLRETIENREANTFAAVTC